MIKRRVTLLSYYDDYRPRGISLPHGREFLPISWKMPSAALFILPSLFGLRGVIPSDRNFNYIIWAKSVVFGLLAGFSVTLWIGCCSLFSGYVESPLPLSTNKCASTSNLTSDYSTFEISNVISPNTTPEPSHGETFFLNKMAFFWIRPISFAITFCCTFIAIFISDRNNTVISSDSKYLSPVVRLWTKKTETIGHHEENISLEKTRTFLKDID
ncbi:hypothetical protein AVEN_60325-1 [Araneus ventricosus]|uniref:Uncharacterized protein n=1 Tax=Araneus ventricosus TaxID=182803 RepID=A0A4Y2MCH8_ARAVE|nr:hypothetical protein AVEN_60325-1 [Araneus ventricosus]